MNHAFIHSLSHSFINLFRYLCSACYSPCTILCAGYIAVNKTKRSCPHETYHFVVHSNDIQINTHYNEDIIDAMKKTQADKGDRELEIK